MFATQSREAEQELPKSISEPRNVEASDELGARVVLSKAPISQRACSRSKPLEDRLSRGRCDRGSSSLASGYSSEWHLCCKAPLRRECLPLKNNCKPFSSFRAGSWAALVPAQTINHKIGRIVPPPMLCSDRSRAVSISCRKT
jgi:hypothetical protein